MSGAVRFGRNCSHTFLGVSAALVLQVGTVHAASGLAQPQKVVRARLTAAFGCKWGVDAQVSDCTPTNPHGTNLGPLDLKPDGRSYASAEASIQLTDDGARAWKNRKVEAKAERSITMLLAVLAPDYKPGSRWVHRALAVLNRKEDLEEERHLVLRSSTIVLKWTHPDLPASYADLTITRRR